MKKMFWLLAVVLMAVATGCTYYNPNNSPTRTRFTGGGPDPGVFYNPRHDYSRPQVLPGTITTYTGQVVPVGGAFAWGGYRWGWNPQTQVYQPVVTQPVTADSIREAANVRYMDMRTENEGRERLVSLLGSRKYRRAQKAVARDLDQLGGLSALSAELMGLKPNSTVEQNPTTSAPLAGTPGAERQARQADQQPAIFSTRDGRALGAVATGQRIDSMTSVKAATTLASPTKSSADKVTAAYDLIRQWDNPESGDIQIYWEQVDAYISEASAQGTLNGHEVALARLTTVWTQTRSDLVNPDWPSQSDSLATAYAEAMERLATSEEAFDKAIEVLSSWETKAQQAGLDVDWSRQEYFIRTSKRNFIINRP